VLLLLLSTDGNKFLMQWKGPFEIVECGNDNNYRVQLDGRVKMFHANMLKKYHVRENADESTHIVGVAAVDDSHEFEMGEITELVNEQKETYQDVHVNPQADEDKKKQVVELLKEFQDVFSDVPKVTNLGEHSI